MPPRHLLYLSLSPAIELEKVHINAPSISPPSLTAKAQLGRTGIGKWMSWPRRGPVGAILSKRARRQPHLGVHNLARVCWRMAVDSPGDGEMLAPVRMSRKLRPKDETIAIWVWMSEGIDFISAPGAQGAQGDRGECQPLAR